jgi:hypothetical protein
VAPPPPLVAGAAAGVKGRLSKSDGAVRGRPEAAVPRRDEALVALRRSPNPPESSHSCSHLNVFSLASISAKRHTSPAGTPTPPPLLPGPSS